MAGTNVVTVNDSANESGSLKRLNFVILTVFRHLGLKLLLSDFKVILHLLQFLLDGIVVAEESTAPASSAGGWLSSLLFLLLLQSFDSADQS